MDEGQEFIRSVPCREASVSALCREWGISRKTGYRWLERYEEDGRAGLLDRSHAPLSYPHQLDAAVIEGVLKLRGRQ